jgi:hypothetical protein
MNSAERRKLEQVQAMTTEALRRIIDHASNSDVKRSPEAPLAGQVAISGIGNVPLNLLRNVVDSR